ncbi:MAG: hypothetical protein JO345_17875 [Streptosporangiaceae bacterium]|nr:hypothetical protein [Streptosporangiaceae bacterium]
MEPALRPGDWLLVLRTRRARPGSIVLARHPRRPGMLLVKRAARRESDGGWWLESDNPAAGAVDSRQFGPVSAIEGRVLFRYRRLLQRTFCGNTNRPRPRCGAGPVRVLCLGFSQAQAAGSVPRTCRTSWSVAAWAAMYSSVFCFGSETSCAQ